MPSCKLQLVDPGVATVADLGYRTKVDVYHINSIAVISSFYSNAI